MVWLLNFRHSEGQIAWRMESLQHYDFTAEHRPGSKHGHADTLSRRPCLRYACKHCDRLESLEQCRADPERATNSSLPPVATLHLCSPDLIGHQPPEALRQAQLADRDIKPILEWLERSPEKPTREEVAPHSQTTKMYWAQWQSLKLLGGVLYRVWETPTGDATLNQLILPESL